MKYQEWYQNFNEIKNQLDDWVGGWFFFTPVGRLWMFKPPLITPWLVVHLEKTNMLLSKKQFYFV